MGWIQYALNSPKDGGWVWLADGEGLGRIYAREWRGGCGIYDPVAMQQSQLGILVFPLTATCTPAPTQESLGASIASR